MSKKEEKKYCLTKRQIAEYMMLGTILARMADDTFKVDMILTIEKGVDSAISDLDRKSDDEIYNPLKDTKEIVKLIKNILNGKREQ